LKYFDFYKEQLRLSNGPGEYKITEDSLWLASIIPLDKKSYLEVGCATGVVSLILSRQNPSIKIKAIDVQEELVKKAKKHADINKIDNVDFVHLDLFKVDENKEVFDCVFSNPPFFDTKKTQKSKNDIRYIAYSQTDLGLFVKKMLSLTKPGGVLCFIAHESTRDSVLKVLKGFWNTTEVGLKSSKNRECKRFLFIVKKEKSSFYQYSVLDCFDEEIRKKFLFEHKKLYKDNSVC